MTDERNRFGAEADPEEPGTAFWAAARRVRTRLLSRLRTSGPLPDSRGPFLLVTCKSCHRPFRTPMDGTSLKTFENIAWRVTYSCPYCEASNGYDVHDHYWERPVD